ncbi:myotubularin-related protein 13 [Elysia marginata]|uniref:Myotubularin-related protein 13 n=1 Tax=Elysia marginata TaxID=1093978 RepID=A0AAV4FMQ9_9GAST|nr:myotubularin-related protein 13 [Elysia marginata]
MRLILILSFLLSLPTGFRCSDCGYNCHEKCLPFVPKNCQKLLKSIGEAGMGSAHLQGNGRPVTDGHDTAPPTSFETYAAAPKAAEHRTHEGYLCKQGAFFKQWKQRWFVLDSMQHQLRYYESSEDGNSKRHIDLAEVESVNLIKSVPGAPKRSAENSFIEISTVRRVYNLMAGDAKSAQDWVEKLQGCLQRD